MAEYKEYREIKLSSFNYDLPKELIALHPTKYRDESRLMVLHKDSGKIEHRQFKEIIEYFGKDDLFVFNNTRVFPAKLVGNKEKTNAMIDVFLLRELNEPMLWDVLVDPARKIRIGNKLFFGENDELVAEVTDNTTSRGRILKFAFQGTYEEFKETLFSLGKTPLPDYIDRPVEPEDEERYQTIFASEEGAVVAPAAGLHFSPELLKRLDLQDVRFAQLTLHNSRVMYDEIDVDDLTKYKMGAERMIINKETCDIINKAVEQKKRIVAVGTSVAKALETAVSMDGFVKPYDGWSSKFIFPEYEYGLQNAMVTGFHLPKSWLLMLVAAFGGYDRVMGAYEVAVKEGYRFGQYGDAMLII